MTSSSSTSARSNGAEADRDARGGEGDAEPVADPGRLADDLVEPETDVAAGAGEDPRGRVAEHRVDERSWIAELLRDRTTACSAHPRPTSAPPDSDHLRGRLAEEPDSPDSLIARRFGRPGEDRSGRRDRGDDARLVVRRRHPGNPVVEQGDGHPDRRLRLGLERPLECGTEVLDLAVETIEPVDHRRAAELQGGRVGHAREEREVAAREIAAPRRSGSAARARTGGSSRASDSASSSCHARRSPAIGRRGE